MAVYDDGRGEELYAAGNYVSINGVVGNGLAKWNGVRWSPVGAGGRTHWGILQMLVHDAGTGPALYVAGGFPSMGGVAASNISRWDGKSWSALGTGTSGGDPPGVVRALCSWDDGNGPALYVGGSFRAAGGAPGTEHLARWDGDRWSDVGFQGNHDVNSLAVYDAGTGPELFASGSFSRAGGRPAPNIARWDGRRWTVVGRGLASFNGVYAMFPFEDTSGRWLWTGGPPWGYPPTAGLGRFQCVPIACYGDFNSDLVLDVRDWQAFQSAYAARDPAADCDTTTGELVFDIFDFLCFQNAFASGCP